MTEPRIIHWKRIAVEAAAIVASILLAFAIDAWWEDRQLDIQEMELIAQLHEEVQANKELFDTYRKLHEGLLDATSRLLRRTGPDFSHSEDEVSEILRDMQLMSDWWTLEPSIGVTSSLVQAGLINVIESNTLRAEISSWMAVLEDVLQEEAYVAKFSQNILYGYWFDNANLRDIGLSDLSGPSKHTMDFDKIFSDRRFENILQEKLLGEAGVLIEYDVLEASTNRLLRLTKEVLDQR
jgi:hypothetical protein